MICDYSSANRLSDWISDWVSHRPVFFSLTTVTLLMAVTRLHATVTLRNMGDQVHNYMAGYFFPPEKTLPVLVLSVFLLRSALLGFVLGYVLPAPTTLAVLLLLPALLEFAVEGGPREAALLMRAPINHPPNQHTFAHHPQQHYMNYSRHHISTAVRHP
jgi:hypothetical protein